MNTLKFISRPLLLAICIILLSMNAYAETTKRVNLFQRTIGGEIDPTIPGGSEDSSIPITCILYKESGRCEFDPDIEAVKKYEIYNGTARVGIYYDQYSFVQDAFNLRGTLILTFTTDSSQLSGKIYNY